MEPTETEEEFWGKKNKSWPPKLKKKSISQLCFNELRFLLLDVHIAGDSVFPTTENNGFDQCC